MTAPFFSIVIPTYNRSNLFPLAVRSLLKQTFEDFEVIVCDNGSADETPRIAREFTDPRVRYARTPGHFVIADSWEFARRQATGRLILMLSDDDALVNTALERFAHEARLHDADFLFSGVATYRDVTFPGSEKNSVSCPGFSGMSRTVSPDEFVQPLFQFGPDFDMHPSAYVFSKALADFIEGQTGRFFWTNGVEFSAWPMSAVFAKRMVFIDAPLIILGRTGKSWGSNTQLCNPGSQKIQAFISDVDHVWKHAPLNNFVTSNLMAEGMLTAKSLFPREFSAYEFDEVQYLRATMGMLRKRRSLGVDVTKEMAEAVQYAEKYPNLSQEFRRLEASSPASRATTVMQRVRAIAGNAGGRGLRSRVGAYRLARALKQGVPRGGFSAAGQYFGFHDILECSEFIDRQVRRTWSRSEDPKAPVASSREEVSINTAASV